MPASLRTILLQVCVKHGVTPNDVVGHRRPAQIVRARAEYIVRARNETSYSFPRIAQAIKKDHTTAVAAYYGGRRQMSEHVPAEISTK
jgi:chromosomal replication initiation ATPase DnaA